MTTETTQALPEVGPASDNGQGQSQGHRRRRRRRKNKTGQPNVATGQQPQSQAPQVAAPQAPPAAPRRQQQQPSQGRKKKKFTPKNPSAQPGNNTSSQQNKRKPKMKGPREFVGPMDHSYRVANGNIDDGPPSTIQLGQMGGGRSSQHWEEPYAPPVQVREDAPVRIYCFIEDLFFLAKIQETARKLGVKVEFVKGADKEAVTRVLELPEESRPSLVVFDLGNTNGKPLTWIPKFKSKFKKTVSVVGFVSHVLGDLKMKASEAGCDTVMPRSAFSQALPNMLRRYGVEEEEELSQQPV
jgi:hypothetical protein